MSASHLNSFLMHLLFLHPVSWAHGPIPTAHGLLERIFNGVSLIKKTLTQGFHSLSPVTFLFMQWPRQAKIRIHTRLALLQARTTLLSYTGASNFHYSNYCRMGFFPLISLLVLEPSGVFWHQDCVLRKPWNWPPCSIL